MNEERMKQAWPQPPEDVIGKVLHLIDNFQGQPDDMWVARATQGIYGPGVTTGLTLGDLRKLIEILGKQTLR